LPNSARLYVYLASVDRREGRWEDSIRNIDRSIELDPRNFFISEEASFTRAGLRRYGEASSLLERALRLNPNDIFARVVLWEMPYREHADTSSWRSHLNAILAEEREAASHIARAFVDCALAERDRTAAEQALGLIPAEGTLDPHNDALWPRNWFVGLVARSFGDKRGAQTAFAAARAIAAENAQEQPDYAPAWEILGAIDAGLGRKDEALNEGKRAIELLPVSKDAWDGPSLVTNLAQIYAWVGEKDLALEQLAVSAKVPAGITYGELKLSPSWDALRDDPRFDKILASLAPRD